MCLGLKNLMKETQPDREDEERCLLIHGFACDGELYDCSEKKIHFEVVGDSLSSGLGLAGAKSLIGAGSAVYGLEGHYALTVAKRFEADIRILSQCGWGVYCSCFNDPIRTMPRYYEQVCGVVTGEKNRALGAFDENPRFDSNPQ